jgi:hypothetical protein
MLLLLLDSDINSRLPIMSAPLADHPDNSEDNSKDMAELKVTAASLLLRSPRLSLSQILELLDIGDAEFRVMTQENTSIRELLAQRRDGTLPEREAELKTCAGCNEWFLPYAGARHCSDECRRIARINGHSKA